MNIRIYNPYLYDIQIIRFYLRIANADIQFIRITNPNEQKERR